MLKEFKEFAVKGNVLDLAVAVIIGAAFGKIVTSFTNDVLMPPIGRVLGKVNFASLFINLTPDKLTKTGRPVVSLADAKDAGAAVIAYGNFINNIIDFVIVAFVLFVVVRKMNQLKKEPAQVVNTKKCPYCTSAIALEATRCPHCTSQLEAAAG